jgi:hypothetical protein
MEYDRLPLPARPGQNDGMDEREDCADERFWWPRWMWVFTDLLPACCVFLVFCGLIVGTIRAIGLFWRPFD